MSTIYNDIFMRANLSSIGEVPVNGDLSHSPDIIPYGVEPVADPVTTFTQNWTKDVGKDVILMQGNYIYVRGKNLASKTQTGDIYLYYCPNALLMWPYKWKDYFLKTSDGKDHITVSGDAGAIVAGDAPFVWIPAPVPPGSDHYCMVARVSTADHPNPIPYADNYTAIDFADLIRNNPAFAWRNVVLVDKGVPTWTDLTNFSVQDTVTRTYHIVVEVTGDLTGCEVSFSCGTVKGLSRPINLNRTKITEINQVVGITVDVDPGFDSSIMLTFWSNNKQIKPGDGLSLKAYLEKPKTNEANCAAIDNLFDKPEVFGLHRAQGLGVEGIPVIEVAAIGQMAYSFK